MPDHEKPQTDQAGSPKISVVRRYRVIAAASIIWAGIVYAAYYAIHKPFTPDNAAAFVSIFVTLVGWIGTVVLAHVLSRLIPFDHDRFSAPVKLSLRIGLGLGLISLILILVGWLPVYQSWVAWIAVLVSLPLGGRKFASEVRAISISRPTTRAEWALVAFVLLMMALAFLMAIAPPTAWDSLVYHLTGPKLLLEARSLIHGIDLPYLGFPNGGAMLFLWGLMLSGPELSQILHWTFALLSLPLLYALASRLAPGRDWLACALLVGVPTASLLASWAYVEWMIMFAGLAAYTMMFPPGFATGSGAGTPSDRFLVLAGLFLGMALSAKYTAIGLAIGLLLALAFQRRKLRPLAVVSVVAALFVAPYLLKNAVLTGNPVYPFFFGGEYWDSLRSFWYSRSGTGLNFVEVLIAPWEATIWGIEGAIVEDHPPFGATIGPALLTLIPFAFIGRRGLGSDQRVLLRSVVIVSVTAYVGWIAMLAFSELLVQTRLLFPVLPFLALLATFGFRSLGKLDKPGRSARFVIGGLIAFGLVMTAISRSLAVARSSPHEVVFGFQSEDRYLMQELGAYQLAIDEINELPAESKVIFLWEPRSFYCDTDIECLPDALLDRWWHARNTLGDEDLIARAWASDGVTHILLFRVGATEIEEAGFDPLTIGDWEALDRFLMEFAATDSRPSDPYRLYSLKSGANDTDG